MNAQVTALNVVVLLIGLLLLIYNKQIGRFLDENFRNLYGLKIEKMLPWFPRFNTIVIDLLFTIGGFANLINPVMNEK